MTAATLADPQCSDEDFRLPGLELQHEMLISLKDWSGVGVITQRLSDEGAEIHALTLHRHGGAFVVKARVKAISSSRARAFVNDLAPLLSGPAWVEHLMLAKAPEHAGA